jgi:hypothetical protein
MEALLEQPLPRGGGQVAAADELLVVLLEATHAFRGGASVSAHHMKDHPDMDDEEILRNVGLTEVKHIDELPDRIYAVVAMEIA